MVYHHNDGNDWIRRLLSRNLYRSSYSLCISYLGHHLGIAFDSDAQSIPNNELKIIEISCHAEKIGIEIIALKICGRSRDRNIKAWRWWGFGECKTKILECEANFAKVEEYS